MNANFKRDLKKFINNKYLMYLVVFFSIVNVFNLVSASKFKTLMIYIGLVVGLCLIKCNITISLVSALIITYFIKKYINDLNEGMESGASNTAGGTDNKNIIINVDSGESKEDEEEVDEWGYPIESFAVYEGMESKNNPGPGKPGSQPAKVDSESTMDEMMDKIPKKNMKKLKDDTKNHADKTQKLLEKAENFEPLMEKAEQMLNVIDPEKLDTMINTLGGALDKLGMTK